MTTRMRNMTRKLIIALLPVALLAVTAQPVLADNWWRDGTDPYSSGCAAAGSWSVFNPVWTGTGWLRLKFSNGCATAWAEFTCATPGGCNNFTLWANRAPDGKSMTDWVTWPSTIPNGVTLYTLQLFDGGWYSTRACYQGYFGAQTFCTGGF